MAYGTQWGTLSLGEDERSHSGQFKIFVSLSDLPQEEHIQWQISETQKNADGMAHGIIFQGLSSWRQNELERSHTWNLLAEPGTRPPGLNQRKLEIAWPPTVC